MKHILVCLSALTFAARTQAETPPGLPLPVASFGAAATDDGSVFIYGGHSGVRHKYNRQEVHGALYHWKGAMTAWEKLSGDEPAQGASLIATVEGVIRIGGMAARNEKGAKQDLWSSETAALYNLGDRSWHPLPKLPQRRSSHDSAQVGDRLYAVGGWALMGGSDLEWHDTYLTLDLSKPEAAWESHLQPFKRRALAVQAVGTKLYAIGGMDSNDEMSNAVAVLDTATGQWRDGPMLPQDKLGGFGFAAAAHEGRLFASGASGVLLELRGEAWVGVARLAHPRFFHRLVPGGEGSLIALGGESRGGVKTPPERIDLPAPDSKPLDGSPIASPSSASSPGAAITWPADLPSIESDWPRYQGPRGDCTTPEVGWSKVWPAYGPPVLWKTELGKGLASFAVVGQRVYTAGNDGADHDTLWCLDLETGKPLWKHTFDVSTRCHEMPIVPYGPAATPTVVGNLAWFISREGHVLCVDANTGTVRWQKHLVNDLGGKRPVYGYSGSPCVHDGRLYLDAGGNTGSNACLDATSGKVLWQTGKGEAGYATPYCMTRDGRASLVSFKGEALELLDATDGKLLARHAMETRDFCNSATPVAWQDTIFISHTGNAGARALRWDGSALVERWSERGLGLLFHSGLPVQGHLLAFNDGLRGANELRLLDLATGKTVWRNTEIEKGTALLTDDGHALMLSSKGELVLAKVLADNLDILQRVQVLGAKCWVQPVLAHRRLLCKNNEGSVVCLDLK